MSFKDLAADPQPPLDALALALAAEFGTADDVGARRCLDEMAGEIAIDGSGPEDQVAEVVRVLGGHYGFRGDTETYDDPVNSMLDLVLERRCGLPILLSIVYVETARRAGIALAAFGVPGHFFCGLPDGKLLIDPFHGGAPVAIDDPGPPWGPHEIALRMLNNLLGSYLRRGDVARALRAAELRVALPCHGESDRHELRALRARMN